MALFLFERRWHQGRDIPAGRKAVAASDFVAFPVFEADTADHWRFQSVELDFVLAARQASYSSAALGCSG